MARKIYTSENLADPMCTKISDIRYMKPLLYISKLLALSPYNFDSTLFRSKKASKFPHYIVHNIYRLIVCIVIVTLNIQVQQFKYAMMYRRIDKTAIVLDTMTTIFLLLVNVFAILGPNIWNKCSFKQMMRTFLRVDAEMHRHGVVGKRKTFSFCGELVVQHSLLITVLTYDNYLMFNKHLQYSRLVEYFQKYHMYIVYIMVYNFIRAHEFRYRCLKCLVAKTIGRHIQLVLAAKTEAVKNVKGKKTCICNDFQSLSSTFTDLCGNIRFLNVVYGWVILSFVAYAMTSLLLSIRFIIFYTSTPPNLRRVGLNMMLTKLTWTVFTAIMSVLLARAANNMVRHVRATAMVCFKLSQKVEEEKFKEYVTGLAQEAALHCPRVSAAGFFNVDYTMLFTLLNLLASYIVVIIQLQK